MILSTWLVVLGLTSLTLAINGEEKQQNLKPHHYSHFSTSDAYFKQSSLETDDETFDIIDDFGLYSDWSWPKLINHLIDLNKSEYQVKLFFLQRHGEGYHNVVPHYFNASDWNCYWQLQDGNGTFEWYDAELTPNGMNEIRNISRAWSNEIKNRDLKLPQSYYVSPLRRTLQTWDLIWNPLVKEDNFDSKNWPVVKELARETYGVGTESKRHNKDYIAHNFPWTKFEKGFSRFDKLWDANLHESAHHRNYRAQLLLEEIFKHDENLVISLVSHSGLIKSILKVIKHRKFLLKTGQMIPVVIKRKIKKHPSKWESPGKKKEWRTIEDYCSI